MENELECTSHCRWLNRYSCFINRRLAEAVLTCSVYGDMNQLRAGMADSFEDSQRSAIYNRLLEAQCLEAQCREAQASHEAFAHLDSAGCYAFSKSEAQAGLMKMLLTCSSC